MILHKRAYRFFALSEGNDDQQNTFPSSIFLNTDFNISVTQETFQYLEILLRSNETYLYLYLLFIFIFNKEKPMP